jgi:hypothetical protein
MDDPNVKPKRGLARFVDSGRAEGARLARRESLGELTPLSELESQLAEAERRVAHPEARLWQREHAAMTLRGIFKAVSGREAEMGEIPARAEALSAVLAELDRREFLPIQERIARGEYRRAELLVDLAARPRFVWDAFVERALGIAIRPRKEKELELDMVHYLPSPFEAVLGVIGELSAEDVFYDLGAGLGKVTLSAAWLSEARAKAVEMEPAFSRVLAERAAALRLSRAEVINADAREVDYSDGTAFYFYDPFRGAILEAVLEKIRAATLGRSVRVFSRGGSTKSLALVPWLERKSALASEVVLFTT